MIIYGSRMYGVSNVVHGFGLCPHCNRYGQHKSYSGRRWGHIYFIPIIPMGGPMRVIKECGSCNMGGQIDEKNLPELRQSLQAGIEACVAAAQRGETLFAHPRTGEETGVAPYLADAVDLLFTAGYAHDIDGLLERLYSEQTMFAYAVAYAASAEIRGDRNGAIEALNAAAAANPTSIYPPFALGALYHRLGDPNQALQYYREANDLAGGDDLNIMLEMSAPLEDLKRYDEVVAILDRCIALAPELQDNKKFMKQYHKLAKKAQKMSR